MPLNQKIIKKIIEKKYPIYIEQFQKIKDKNNCLILSDTKANKYFLKLYKNKNNIIKQIYLFNNFKKKCIKNIPVPIKSNSGEEGIKIIDKYGIIFEYIEGQTFSSNNDFSKKDIEQIGRIIAKIHKFTPRLGLKESQFEFNKSYIAIKKNLQKQIKNIESIKKTNNIQEKRLQKLIINSKELIIKELKNLRQITVILPTKKKIRQALCHCDLNGSNFIKNNCGKIFLLDWDCATFSPAERDLEFFVNNKYSKNFLRSYAKSMNYINFNIEFIYFFSYWRNLSRMSFHIKEIMDEGNFDHLKLLKNNLKKIK